LCQDSGHYIQRPAPRPLFHIHPTPHPTLLCPHVTTNTGRTRQGFRYLSYSCWFSPVLRYLCTVSMSCCSLSLSLSPQSTAHHYLSQLTYQALHIECTRQH